MKKIFIISIILIILIGGIVGYSYIKKGQIPKYEFADVKKGTVTQEVDATGNVKPADQVDLAFENNGKITQINVKVGDKIASGQILLSLNNSGTTADLRQAEAKLLSAKANLNELKRGARPEELQIAETKVKNTEQALSDAQENLTNVKNKADIDLNNLYAGIKNILNEAYAYTDDALNNQVDALFSGDNGTSPQLTFSTDLQIESETETQRLMSGIELQAFEAELDSLPSDQANLDVALLKAEGHLIIIRNLLNKLVSAVNASTGLSQSTMTSYLGYIYTGRNNINTYLNKIATREQDIATQKITNQKNITTAETTVNDDKSALKLAQDELSLKLAGSTIEEIAAQEAAVAQAEANVNSYQIQLDKTVLRSPIAGVVTLQNAKLGETVTANVPIISLMSEAKFEIEADVPEADIAKIKIGNQAKVTLDAYGDNVIFEAQVITINPAETIIGGVPTYKTTFQFTQENEQIKSGMTANLTVLTDKHENVLFIPQRTITNNGQSFVYIYKNKNQEKREIKIGLYGSDGNVEIVNGLNEGEKVIIPKD